jgi:rare lipoprotein A
VVRIPIIVNDIVTTPVTICVLISFLKGRTLGALKAIGCFDQPAPSLHLQLGAQSTHGEAAMSEQTIDEVRGQELDKIAEAMCSNALRSDTPLSHQAYIRAVGIAAVATALAVTPTDAESGIASIFDGGKTASGRHLTAHDWAVAHKTIRLGSLVRITNVRNGRSVTAPVRDRGPYVKSRIVDCLPRVAAALGINGLASVILTIISKGH